MTTTHFTNVLLYSSTAGTCKKNVLPILLIVISGVFSSVNNEPLTSQPTAPIVALQLKVAVDPSVALIDVGVVIKARTQMRTESHNTEFHVRLR